MKSIKVEEWCNILVEGEPDIENYSLDCKLRETSVYSVEITNICTSLSLSHDHSKVLYGDQEHIYGNQLSAIDRAIELALTALSEHEIGSVSIKLSGKYISNCFETDVLDLSFEIKYTIKEHGKYIFDFTNVEKFKQSEKYKSIGVNLLKSDNNQDLATFTNAFICFSLAIKWCILVDLDDLEDINKETIDTLKMQCYNNISQHHIRQCHFDLAIVSASKVLDKDPNNIKGLYRRALAQTRIQEYDQAKLDLNNALKIDPNNKTIRKLLNDVILKLKEIDNKYAKAMKKFLS